MTDDRFDSPPGFYDPDDDGINYYYNEQGERITKAEWLASEGEMQKEIDIARENALPVTSAAFNRLTEAGADFEDFVAAIAEDIARELGHTEVQVTDVNTAAARAWSMLRPENK